MAGVGGVEVVRVPYFYHTLVELTAKCRVGWWGYKSKQQYFFCRNYVVPTVECQEVAGGRPDAMTLPRIAAR